MVDCLGEDCAWMIPSWIWRFVIGYIPLDRCLYEF